MAAWDPDSLSREGSDVKRRRQLARLQPGHELLTVSEALLRYPEFGSRPRFYYYLDGWLKSGKLHAVLDGARWKYPSWELEWLVRKLQQLELIKPPPSSGGLAEPVNAGAG